MLGLLIAASLAAFAPVARSEQCPADRSPIMILGTYHMANPGLDSVNIEADDVLSPRREAEIADLVERLGAFRPTKVLVEAPYSERARLRQRYERYLAGEYRLSRNEVDQLGFRLARRLGLSEVIAIDFPMMMSGLTYDELEFRPRPAGQAAAASAPRGPTEDELRLHRSTVAEYLAFMNDPVRWHADHLGYMQLFEPDPDSPALYERTDRLVNWYKRNFRMWANIVRTAERPSDRVLVIVGAGHLAILRGLARDMPGFCLVEPGAYLLDG